MDFLYWDSYTTVALDGGLRTIARLAAAPNTCSHASFCHFNFTSLWYRSTNNLQIWKLRSMNDRRHFSFPYWNFYIPVFNLLVKWILWVRPLSFQRLMHQSICFVIRCIVLGDIRQTNWPPIVSPSRGIYHFCHLTFIREYHSMRNHFQIWVTTDKETASPLPLPCLKFV